ncbi:GlgB N-terminal domain-containing protein, partial [Pseudomonas sp.]|uniref:GlgB N-terminal domain-containing protein n=3 Tax=Pseudomonas TaxID=286 RepID=UPI003916D1DF
MNATTRENGGLRQRDLDALARAEHADPFAVLGPHGDGQGGLLVRAFLPNALSVRVLARHDGRILADMVQGSLPGLFTAHLDEAHPYLLQIGWAGGEQVTEDPYSFGPQLGDMDLYLFAEGNHRDLSGRFGAQPTQVEGVDGVCFSVWA